MLASYSAFLSQWCFTAFFADYQCKIVSPALYLSISMSSLVGEIASSSYSTILSGYSLCLLLRRGSLCLSESRFDGSLRRLAHREEFFNSSLEGFKHQINGGEEESQHGQRRNWSAEEKVPNNECEAERRTKRP